jgi:hypothetical protein
MATRLYSHLLGTPEDHAAALTTIITREPLVSYVVDLLNQLCLKNGVKMSIAFCKPSKEFTDFFEEVFLPVLPQILKFKLYCGFVPWVVRTNPKTGDKMPMVLPIGSFSWTTRTKEDFDVSSSSGSNSFPSSKRQRTGSGSKSKEASNQTLDYTSICEYVVESIAGLCIPSGDIHVINLIEPTLSNSNGAMGQVQYSPLYIAVQKYLAFDLAQQRRCYADDWSTTARIFTTQQQPELMNERAGRNEIPFGTTRFAQASMPDGFFTYDNQRLQYQKTSAIVADALEHPGGRGSEHTPSVYSLPLNYNIAPAPELKPLMDIALLERQYRMSVAHCLGIPLHLVDNDTNSSSNMYNDLPFTSEMVSNTCGSLITLMEKTLSHMYSTVYHGDLVTNRGPVSSRKARFVFEPEELYSTKMRTREDDRIRLEKTKPENQTPDTKKPPGK